MTQHPDVSQQCLPSVDCNWGFKNNIPLSAMAFFSAILALGQGYLTDGGIVGCRSPCQFYILIDWTRVACGLVVCDR